MSVGIKAALIIPIYNQSQYFIRMLDALESQSVLPFCVYLLLDRIVKKDYLHIKSLCDKKNNLKNKFKLLVLNDIPTYMGKPDADENLNTNELCLTGYRRNQGVSAAINDGCNFFIFIDGDCIPECDLVKSHINSVNLKYPIILCGKRKESKYNWMDQRELDPNLSSLNLFKPGGTLIYNKEYLLSSAIVWTCNLSINLEAVNLIKKLNSLYYNRNELFNSDFLGSYGGEDSFLGIEAYVCKCIISSIADDNSGIRHIDHPRPEKIYSLEKFQMYLVKKMKELDDKLIKTPLTMDFFK